VIDFDAFLGHYVGPALRADGFKKDGRRRYSLTDSSGNAVVVQPSLRAATTSVSFHIDWAAIPAVLFDFYSEGTKQVRPTVDRGLIRARLTCPLRMRYLSGADQTWHFDESMAETYGSDLFRVLTATAIPKWRRALTREYFVQAHDDYFTTPYAGDPDLQHAAMTTQRGGPYWLRAILAADHGDPWMANYAIDTMAVLNPDDALIPWLRERLGRRLDGSAIPDEETVVATATTEWRHARERVELTRSHARELRAAHADTARERLSGTHLHEQAVAQREGMAAEIAFWNLGGPTGAPSW
jgi:hypothetical protein